MKNIIKLPEFTVEKVASSLSESIDWGLLERGIPDTWEITKGEGINVYVLDTAGDTDHIDLRQNLIGGKAFVRREGSMDVNGHSTHCAGIIAAEQNGIGIVGVAPKAKVCLVKVLGDEGSGSSSAIYKGLKYAFDKIGQEDGPDVVSMSLGADGDLGRKIHKMIKKIHDAGVPIICAAGNSGREGVNYPAKYPETIAIGAFDRNGNLASFSTTGQEVDFVAPGVDIYSTWPNGTYAKLSGTSMATPFVAGIVALLLAKHKKQEKETGLNDCTTPLQVKEHLIRHSEDKGGLGKDKDWGFGIVNVDNLLREGHLEQKA